MFVACAWTVNSLIHTLKPLSNGPLFIHLLIRTRLHSLTVALDQLRVVASYTSNDPGPRSGQHQQVGQCLLPLVAANFFVDDPAGASSQRQEECWCGLLLTVAMPAKLLFSNKVQFSSAILTMVD